MNVIARRKDGVLLVSLGTGSYAAVNLTSKRVAPVDPRALYDFATWPEMPRSDRAQYNVPARNVLNGPHRRVSLDDVGYGAYAESEASTSEQSLDERRQAICRALDAAIKARFGNLGGGGLGYPSMAPWVKDIYDQADPPYLVYCDNDGKHFKWTYAQGDEGIEMVGDPVPIQYVPVELRAGLAEYAKAISLSLKDQEHPFTYCMEHIASKKDLDDPEAFCAYLVHEQTGEWPAEHAAKKKAS